MTARKKAAAPAAKKKAPARRKAPADPVARIEAAAAQLEAALGELPRGAEFEPLAEHLYEFARVVPTLVEALGRVPAAAEPVNAAVRSLQEVSETLQFTQESFAESVLGLPTAEEYQPLVEPLTEFARVAPQLAASLKDVLGATLPMRDAARVLDGVTARLERVALRAEATAPDVRDDVAAARDAIVAALSGLPKDDDYAKVASQLRELATVSPSLMEWLKQAGTIQAPLQGSVRDLTEAARRLDRVLDRLG